MSETGDTTDGHGDESAGVDGPAGRQPLAVAAAHQTARAPAEPALLPQEPTEPFPDPVSIVAVTLKTPPTGLSFSGPQPGAALEVTGTYTVSRVTDAAVHVIADGHAYPATLSPLTTPKTWKSTIRFYRAARSRSAPGSPPTPSSRPARSRRSRRR